MLQCDFYLQWVAHMVRFEHVEKTYLKNGRSVEALKHINLDIQAGSVFGIIGHSGAGKSTLLRLINGLESPSSGRLSVLGQDLSAVSAQELKRLQKQIGMVFQHFNLLDSKTVFENVALPLRLNKVGKQEVEERVNALLDYVGLADKAQMRPHQLSGGQKQRVGIARALVNRPQILLCDEATSALDPQTTASILGLLKKINQEQGITIVLITHEMEVIQKIAQQVAVMSEGEIVEAGSTAVIFQHPQHRVTQEFIATVIQKDFPLKLVQQLNTAHSQDSQIVRLEFLQQSAQQTVMNDMLLTHTVKANILFANMIEIDGQVIGSMFVELTGRLAERSVALQYLTDRNVVVDQGVAYV